MEECKFGEIHLKLQHVVGVIYHLQAQGAGGWRGFLGLFEVLLREGDIGRHTRRRVHDISNGKTVVGAVVVAVGNAKIRGDFLQMEMGWGEFLSISIRFLKFLQNIWVEKSRISILGQEWLIELFKLMETNKIN